MEMYRVGNETAILYSVGFGAGWSTWNQEALAYDKRIIEYWNPYNLHPSAEQMEKYLEELGYEDVYMGGYEDLEIEWVPTGSLVRINEYDGAESIEIFSSNKNWIQT